MGRRLVLTAPAVFILFAVFSPGWDGPVIFPLIISGLGFLQLWRPVFLYWYIAALLTGIGWSLYGPDWFTSQPPLR